MQGQLLIHCPKDQTSGKRAKKTSIRKAAPKPFNASKHHEKYQKQTPTQPMEIQKTRKIKNGP